VSDPSAAILGGSAAVMFVLAAIAVVWLHFQPAGVDNVREGVSAYGVGSYGAFYRFQVIASGIGGLLVAGALALSGATVPFGLAFLAIYGAARIAIAWFPTDLEGPMTRTGWFHVLLAAVAFISIAIAAPAISLSLAGTSAWHGLAPIMVPLAFAVTASVVATFASNSLVRTRPIFGAVERVVYVTGFAWLLVASLGALLVSL
jgi:hypothetical protein